MRGMPKKQLKSGKKMGNSKRKGATSNAGHSRLPDHFTNEVAKARNANRRKSGGGGMGGGMGGMMM